MREGDSREQNFRFQRRDIEVAIHRSVQSSTSLPFFSQIIAFNWPFICHYLFVSDFKAKALFHLEKKNPGRQSSLVVTGPIYSARSARE